MQVKIITDIASEPVTLDEVKNFCRLDLDYPGDDVTLALLVASAREKLEGFLNIYFGVKTIEVQFTGHELKLPYGPTGDIESVISDGVVQVLNTDYELHGLEFKTICTELLSEQNWFYPIGGGAPHLSVNLLECKTFNVIYETGYIALPSALKHALLIQVDYMFKNQGTALNGLISPLALSLANRYSQNLVI